MVRETATFKRLSFGGGMTIRGFVFLFSCWMSAAMLFCPLAKGLENEKDRQHRAVIAAPDEARSTHKPAISVNTRRYRIPLEVDTGSRSYQDSPVSTELDLAAIAQKAGIQTPSLDSLLLIEGKESGPLVPFLFQARHDRPSTGRLVWKMTGRTPSHCRRFYCLYLDTPNTDWKPRPKELVLTAGEKPVSAGLVGNSGFEQMDVDGKTPIGWRIPTTKQLAPGDTVSIFPEDKKSGHYSLKIVQTGNKEFTRRCPTAISPRFVVNPRKKYKISGWVKQPRGNGVIYIMLWWRGENGGSIGNRKFWASLPGSCDWTYLEAVGEAPMEAYCAEIKLSLFGPTAAGTVYFDDIQCMLCPDVDKHNPTLKVKVGNLKKRQ